MNQASAVVHLDIAKEKDITHLDEKALRQLVSVEHLKMMYSQKKSSKITVIIKSCF